MSYNIMINKNQGTKIQNKQLQIKGQTTTSITHASKRTYQLIQKKQIKFLNIDYFKLNPCLNNKQHIHKHCVYFHNVKDRKRFGNYYSDNLCLFVSRGEKCPKGEECTDAHSRVEQLYQHQTYKKKFCSHYPNNVDKCQYGDYCSFAHSQDEIRTELIHNYQFDEDFYMFHYKTQFCPFNLTQHDKALCVYAHNLQDYRRNPALYYYQPFACFNWKFKDFIYNYEIGCENGLNCGMCHGWKQIQYHPNIYKTIKCLQIKCRKGQCSNYHSEKQKRIVQENIVNRCFRYIARNRIVNNTFKPESEESFIPKHEIKMHTVIGSMSNPNKEYSADFSAKTEIRTQKLQKNNEQKKQQKYLQKQNVQSQNQYQSNNDNLIKYQIQKILPDA